MDGRIRERCADRGSGGGGYGGGVGGNATHNNWAEQMENIDEYYRSLKKIFDYLVDWKQPTSGRGWVSKVFTVPLVASVVCLLLTLIPVLPFMLSVLLPRRGRELAPVIILGVYLEPLMQYWLSCLVGSVASTTIFGLLYNYVKPPPSEPEYSLSADQVSFVVVYSAFEELRLYLIDNLTDHVDKARRAVEKLFLWPLPLVYRYRSLPSEAQLEGTYRPLEDFPARVFVPEETYRHLPTPAMASQLEITSNFLRIYERYHWFRMDEQTRAALQALASFPSKIYSRLEGKEDLAKVKTVLEHMARWMYAYLPELEASRAPEDLQALRDAGDQELVEVAAIMESLTEYELPSPPEPVRRPRRPSIIHRMLESEDIPVRFVRYFILVLILTSALSFVAVQVFEVQQESAVLMTISTSVLGAAGLAVVPVMIRGERKS